MTTDKQETDELIPELPKARKIEMTDPWMWLVAGWKDLRKGCWLSLGYGVTFSVSSIILITIMVYMDLNRMILPALAGFMLMGPILAVGLFHASRCMECNTTCGFKKAFHVRTKAPSQLMFISAILLLATLSWMRIGVVIYTLFFGLEGVGDKNVLDAVLFTSNGLIMLAVGSMVGAFIATLIFFISVFSIPMLMIRNCDALSAIIFSISACLKNPGPMLLWGVMITVLVGFGFVTGFIGFVITYPLAAHASWHAFRSVIDVPGSISCEDEVEEVMN
ncbi:MAG: DUF2189 domain-containing protein [bacterium]